VLKLILKRGKSLIGKLFVYDCLDLDFQVFSTPKNPSCPLCGKEAQIKGLKDYRDGKWLEPEVPLAC